MRILDTNNNEITSPDLSLGHLEKESIFVKHHEAKVAVEEVGHYEVIAEYPETGGKDVEWIIDVPGVIAGDAWEEYEEIMRYIPYTAEELAEIEACKNAPTLDSRVLKLEAETADLTEALELLLLGVTE